MINVDKAFEGRWRLKGNSTLTMMHDALDGKLTLQELSVKIASLCRDFFEAGIELAQEPKIIVEARSPLEVRAESFAAQVFSKENQRIYPQPLLEEFVSYWTEPNRSKTKMRFELQKTWDLSRRLSTWAKNDYSGYVRKQQSPQQNAEKLTDILVG